MVIGAHPVSDFGVQKFVFVSKTIRDQFVVDVESSFDATQVAAQSTVTVRLHGQEWEQFYSFLELAGYEIVTPAEMWERELGSEAAQDETYSLRA